jgi:hypothetical protein
MPRGSRPWSADEAKVRLAAEFVERVQARHAVERESALELVENAELAAGSKVGQRPLLRLEG